MNAILILTLMAVPGQAAPLVSDPPVAEHGQVRGGPVLQSPDDPPGLDPSQCPPFDPATATPFCTLVEWHRIERADAANAENNFNMDPEELIITRCAADEGPVDASSPSDPKLSPRRGDMHV